VTSDYHVLRTPKIFSYVYGEQYIVKAIGSKTTKKRNYHNWKKIIKSIL